MNERPRRFNVIWGARIAALSIVVLSPLPAEAQDPAWLKGIDELMQVPVTSASKREQQLADAAAAVFVLTREDIRRSGLRDVPSLLRLVPGVQVAQIDATKWAISVRGFNSRWANKLLVMVDGQSIYSDVFSGVYWNAVDVPVEAIERIEIVRGPGGSLWGANAVNGVINIITRGSGSSGGAATAHVGLHGLSTATLRYAGSARRLRYQLFVDGGDQDAIAPAITRDGWSALRTGGGVQLELSARDALDLQTAWLDSHSWATGPQVVSSVPLRRAIVDQETDTETARAGAKWTRRLSGGGRIEAAASWADTHRDDGVFRLDSQSIEASLQHAAAPWRRHEVTWGASYRRSTYLMEGTPTYDLNPGAALRTVTGAFIQDEIAAAADRVAVTIGTKVERFDDAATYWQPTARVRWNATAGHTVWGAVSRAVRTPSLSERGLVVNLFEVPGRVPMIAQLYGNPALRAELLLSYEIGYRWTSRLASVDVAGFHNHYDGAVDFTIGRPQFVARPAPHLILPFVLANNRQVETAGGEALVTVSGSPWWRVVAGYSLFSVRSRLDAGSEDYPSVPFDAGAPRHQGSVRSTFALPRGLDVEATVFLVGALAATEVPAYARTDLRIAWRALPSLDLSVHGEQILGGSHFEFGDPSGGVVIGPAPRMVSVTATWRF